MVSDVEKPLVRSELSIGTCCCCSTNVHFLSNLLAISFPKVFILPKWSTAGSPWTYVRESLTRSRGETNVLLSRGSYSVVPLRVTRAAPTMEIFQLKGCSSLSVGFFHSHNSGFAPHSQTTTEPLRPRGLPHGSLLVIVTTCDSADGTRAGPSPWFRLGRRDKLFALMCCLPGRCWIS